MWEVVTREAFDEWFESLGDTPRGIEAQVEIDATIEVLRKIGPRLGRPHADTLKGSDYANLKELRVPTAAMVIRIAFAFDPLQKAILLFAGDKSGVSEKRFYKQLISRADKEYAEHPRIDQQTDQGKGRGQKTVEKAGQIAPWQNHLTNLRTGR
ncbi:MAG TPA: type II toxin-antitoxin system RelE/ParE family toxin [Tepidisphaeraceae bacterium]|nr:type II toxin-antitoxin system RelE/ParE family toxin [Tepidisphaeraceae bacterium]